MSKSAQLEAEHFAEEYTGMLAASQLAHLPSPHRRRCGLLQGLNSLVEPVSPAEALLTPGSYRDKLRANGQRALQRSWDCGIMTSPNGGTNSADIAVGQDQYSFGLPPAPSPPLPWTQPAAAVGASAFWAEASNEVPQAAQIVPISPLLNMPLTPSNMNSAPGQTDGLMAIAMPQCSDMNGEQIAAQLRAAAPMSYED